ncbi:MAG TPA: glycoside hydrolase family 18 protein [Mycobacteriales bacterium]|jgi:chitinase|nr:glycoside hydrolase family 18 protein [Mycobacteriales bacterium]
MPPRRPTLLAAICVLALSSAAGVATATVAAPLRAAPHVSAAKPWVMGYYPEYQRALMPPKEIDWRGLTHLAVGRVVPNDDGTLDTAFDYDATRGPALAKQLSKLAKAHHVVPILMVGGAGERSHWRSAAGHHRAALVSHLVAAMRAYGYRGLDLDWEPIATADEPTLLKLVTALRQAAPGVILTVPVNWVAATSGPAHRFYGRLAKQVQRLDIMAYGMAGAYPGWRTWHSSALRGAQPDTPADIVSNVKAYRAAGVPAGKLGLGVGFYGTCWAGGVDGPNQDIGESYVQADDNVMTYDAIMSDYFSPSNYHYDSAAEAPYLGYAEPTGPQGCTFISYENPRSIKAKGAYARAHHLGGAIIWTINQAHRLGASPGQTDPLLRTTYRAFVG